MRNIIDYIPEAETDEAMYLAKVLEGVSDETAERFSKAYRTRRKDPQMILILCLLSFVGLSGIHRIMLKQVGMGLLYFFTAGLCLIGTIVDLINYKDMTFRYNSVVAQKVLKQLKN